MRRVFARPHPQATAGRPISLQYSPDSRVGFSLFQFQFFGVSPFQFQFDGGWFWVMGILGVISESLDFPWFL